MRYVGDLQPQRQVLLAVVVVAIVSAGVLGWLGRLLVQQDAALDRQRQADMQQLAGDRVAAAMRQAFADLTRRPQTPASSDEGLLHAEFRAGSLAVMAEGRVLYRPVPAAGRPVVVAAFSSAETREFSGDLVGALREYEQLARAPDDVTRAAALSRSGRVLRKLGRTEQAVATYEVLTAMGTTPAEGLPGVLVARVGRASAFEDAGRTAELRREAAGLRDDLLGGRLPISQAQFAFYATQAGAWTGAPVRPSEADLARADGLAWAWEQVRAAQEPGTRALRLPHGPAIVSWSLHQAGVRVTVADARHLTGLCAAAEPRYRCAVHDGAGEWLAGARDVVGASSRLVTDEKGGMWTVRVAPVAAMATGASPRRALLLSTVALAGLVLAAGWYFILRGMARERAAGRAQADFVAAVSHEFRSPLTSMAHIAEMLASGRIAGGESQARAYGVLVHDTDRLRTLVEQLLEFGRFEAGGPVLRLERIDVAEAVRAIVEDFRARVTRDGCVVEYDGPTNPAWIDADREALALALWNLMDNAVKYSPDTPTIRVRLQVGDGDIALSVRDEGLGIPGHEQAAIFRQFVRGEEPKSRRIRGTGIGLALVRHVARAHGGDVTVESEPGTGSTFTVSIPR